MSRKNRLLALAGLLLTVSLATTQSVFCAGAPAGEGAQEQTTTGLKHTLLKINQIADDELRSFKLQEFLNHISPLQFVTQWHQEYPEDSLGESIAQYPTIEAELSNFLQPSKPLRPRQREAKPQRVFSEGFSTHSKGASEGSSLTPSLYDRLISFTRETPGSLKAREHQNQFRSIAPFTTNIVDDYNLLREKLLKEGAPVYLNINSIPTLMKLPEMVTKKDITDIFNAALQEATNFNEASSGFNPVTVTDALAIVENCIKEHNLRPLPAQIAQLQQKLSGLRVNPDLAEDARLAANALGKTVSFITTVTEVDAKFKMIEDNSFWLNQLIHGVESCSREERWDPLDLVKRASHAIEFARRGGQPTADALVELQTARDRLAAFNGDATKATTESLAAQNSILELISFLQSL